ncbi:AraC family transcriptional regulator [Isoptericola sediminis]|uniref:AraC family transcriptional regulator n=1 Tax=Isoptericola sediminis TaxID=2733572 RepID=A0A849KBN4_9MICO|nr:helix-turn-helix domain-containing protein [Isoptericola sediminis]NNU28657.1 AraC family transcriptional regulator [Isoptericola sediminis]
MQVPSSLRLAVRSVTAYDLDLPAGGTHRGVPGPDVVLEIALDAPLDVRWADRPDTRQRAWSVLSGLHTRPAQVEMPARARGVSVRLTPWGARKLLGMPCAELAGRLVSLDEAAPGLSDLPERLAASRRPADELVLLLQHALREAASDGPGPVDAALAALCRGRPVAVSAAAGGWSRRHLQDLVHRECGLSPRDLRRVGRLARSRVAMVRGAGRSLADVAAGAGYADHAHLTREWKDLAGCTPTTFLREELPYVQAAEVPDGGG